MQIASAVLHDFLEKIEHKCVCIDFLYELCLIHFSFEEEFSETVSQT